MVQTFSNVTGTRILHHAEPCDWKNKLSLSIASFVGVTCLVIGILALLHSQGIVNVFGLGAISHLPCAMILLGSLLAEVSLIYLIICGVLNCRMKKDSSQGLKSTSTKGPESTSANVSGLKSNNECDPVAILPKDVSLQIFSYLNLNELDSSSQVSKRWRDFLSIPSIWDHCDLKEISSSIEFFDESDWKEHVDLTRFELSVDDAPKLDKLKTFRLLKKCLSSLSITNSPKGIKIFVVTLPKGLSLKKLPDLVREPQKGHKGDVWDGGWYNPYKALDKTYRIIITNLFSKSRILTPKKQKIFFEKFMQNIRQKSDLDLKKPTTLEAATLAAVTIMRSGEIPYHRKSKKEIAIFTACEHTTDDILGVPIFKSVGCFPTDRLSPPTMLIRYNSEWFGSLGLSGVLVLND